MSRLSEERLKEADHSRMRDESAATLVPVEEDGEPTLVPFLLPDSRPTRLNLLRDRSGIATGLVVATAFLLGGAVLAPLWASGRLDVMTWIERVIHDLPTKTPEARAAVGGFDDMEQCPSRRSLRASGF